MLRFCFVSALVVAASGCATDRAIDRLKLSDAAQEQQRALLVGKWIGDAMARDGSRRLQITERNADGTFKVTFRHVEPTGAVSEQTEVGYWGVSGSIYFTITVGWLDEFGLREADPTDASLNDAYQILELTEQRFRYRALQSGDEFSLSRVADTFEFSQTASEVRGEALL